MKREKEIAISGHYEADATVSFLPRCAACSGVHPLARHPKMPHDKCPDCGRPAATPEEHYVESVLIDRSLSMRFANLLLWLGRFFHNLAKGMQK